MHARDLYRRLKVYGIALNRSDVFETSFLTENQILELLEFVVAHFLGYS